MFTIQYAHEWYSHYAVLAAEQNQLKGSTYVVTELEELLKN